MEGAATGAVGLESYMTGSPFGGTSQAELGDLNKALSALHVTGRETADSQALSGAPIKSESLERTLRSLEFTEGDLRIYQDIPKLPAYNTVEEYNRLISYGDSEGGFMAEGELPEERDTIFERKAELVKFVGDVRRVTHQMSLVKTAHAFGSAVALETKHGMMNVLRICNREIVRSNASHVGVQFNGVYAQHQAGAGVSSYTAQENVIDLRGFRLNEGNLDDAGRVISEAFGSFDTLYAPPSVLGGFVKAFYPDGRYMYPSAADTTVGFAATKAQTQWGSINLKYDKFMQKRPAKTAASGTTAGACPPNPIAVGAAVAAGVGSKFAAADAGDYFYAVSAFNKYGESQITLINAGLAAAVIAGAAVDLTFTEGAPISGRPTEAYRIYRAVVDEATPLTAEYFPIFDISAADLANGYDGAAVLSIRDNNHYMINCQSAFLLQNSLDQWSYKQLAPIMKVELAMTTLAYKFAVVQYGTPILYQPPKVVRFINVGDTPTP